MNNGTKGEQVSTPGQVEWRHRYEGSNGPVVTPRPRPSSVAAGAKVNDAYRLATEVMKAKASGHLRYWRGDYYHFRDGAFRRMSPHEIAAVINLAAEQVFTDAYRREREAWERGARKGKEPVKHSVTCTTTSDVSNVLRSLPEIRLDDDLCPPCWVDNVNGPNAAECVVVTNGIVDLSTGRRHDHNPSFFSLGMVSYPHDENAGCPDWDVITESLPDQETRETLDEWLGYCLTRDMSHEKFLLLVGHPRSGKGTILHVLQHLVGSQSYAAVNLNNFGGTFAAQKLVGKLVAVDGDVRLRSKKDEVAMITARLISIVGRDATDIDIKHKEAVTANLTCRFSFACNANAIPKIGDADGAVAARTLALMTGESRTGREDLGLKGRILTQLPGILNRAIAGLRRLRERGSFRQPASGQHIVDQLAGDPVRQFVRTCCDLEADARAPTADLYKSWCEWCRLNGRPPGTDATFGAAVLAIDGVTKSRPTVEGNRVWVYDGISIHARQDAV